MVKHCLEKHVENDHFYKYQWLYKHVDMFMNVCILCRCMVVYLCLHLTSLPDDNSSCSHGSTLSNGAH